MKALRAKFSTLTDDEIRQSFASLSKPNSGLAQAGRSRHILDFIYGVNLSRALAKSLKTTNRYRNLSIGRVQGPTLAFAVDKELEIRLHVPDPYWTIAAWFDKSGQTFNAHYEKSKVEALAQAQSIVNACTGKEGVVNNLSSKQVVLRSPTPFNIGDLQREAYRLFKVFPAQTLSIAERLYLRALISYPRTSSQKLPPSIGYSKIISRLAAISADYASLIQLLCKQYHNLSPNEGKKNDPAHAAIYPTGQKPSNKLQKIEFKIYDLIVRRFLATFANPSISLHTIVSIKINDYIFNTEGKIQIYEGWTQFYKPYFRSETLQHLPELH